MESGLRGGRRKLWSASASTSSHQRKCDVAKRDGSAGEDGNFHSDSAERHGHECGVERRWRSRRKRKRRDDHGDGCLHCAGGLAVSGSGAGDGNEPPGSDQVGKRHRDGRERYRFVADAKHCRRGARRDTGISSGDSEQRAPGYNSSVERFWRAVSRELRRSGRERHLHGAANPAIVSKRYADGAERG
jgi:hypothetical protein